MAIKLSPLGEENRARAFSWFFGFELSRDKVYFKGRGPENTDSDIPSSSRYLEHNFSHFYCWNGCLFSKIDFQKIFYVWSRLETFKSKSVREKETKKNFKTVILYQTKFSRENALQYCTLRDVSSVVLTAHASPFLKYRATFFQYIFKLNWRYSWSALISLQG